jgi:hypothetical protein
LLLIIEHPKRQYKKAQPKGCKEEEIMEAGEKDKYKGRQRKRNIMDVRIFPYFTKGILQRF